MKKKRREAGAPVAPAAAVSRTEARDSTRYYLAALVVVTLLAFSNSFSTGFALDNQVLLLSDTRIQTASAANIGLIIHHTYWWPNGESGLYRPLTTLTYLLNYAILGNGDHPAGYHWINFFLHTANVILWFFLVLRLMKGRDHAVPAAFFAAMLWAVHPVLTESVTNIVGSADLLAGLGVLSGLLCYLKSSENSGWRRGVWLAGLAAATAVGVFSKESAVVLPAVILLYEIACGNGNGGKCSQGASRRWCRSGLMLWQRTMVLSASLPAEYPFVIIRLPAPGSGSGGLRR